MIDSGANNSVLNNSPFSSRQVKSLEILKPGSRSKASELHRSLSLTMSRLLDRNEELPAALVLPLEFLLAVANQC